MRIILRLFRDFHFIFISFHFICLFIQIFRILFSHCPQIAKASPGGTSVYIKQNTHSKWYYIKLTGQQKFLSLYKILSCTKGKKQKKGYVKNNAEINWNTECKSEAYKFTIN